MDKFYTETLHKLETAINELEIEADYPIQRIETVIDIILNNANQRLDQRMFPRVVPFRA